MSLRVLICIARKEADTWTRLFRQALPGADVRWRDPDAPADPSAPQADYVVLGARSHTLFLEQRAMRAVFTLSAGVRYALTLPGLDARVPLVRLEDAGMAEQMTRYVVAAALRFALGLDRYRDDQVHRRWERRDPRDPSTISAGVLGYGVIGGRIASGLLASGFVVRGHARTLKSVPGVRMYAGRAGFDDFLRGLDFLVAVLPATDESSNLLDRRALELLAPGAHLVNIGRGVHVVDADLVAVLDSGHLGGATLDVYREEPLPADHPFWARRDVTMTPHVSGITLPAPSVAQIVDKIGRLERGEPVTGVVDRARGY